MKEFNSPFDHFSHWYDGKHGSALNYTYRKMNQSLQKLLSVMDPALARISDNAFSISTADSNGQPSSRMVLLKSYSEKGFEFFTSYDSRKGQELTTNPKVHALFYWQYPLRQIRIEGTVEKMTYEESSNYWNTRPKESQLSGMASAQSSEIRSYDELLEARKSLANEFKNKPIPCPKNWGGFRVVPLRFEFWHGRMNRLHERLVYTKNNSSWDKSYLAP